MTFQPKPGRKPGRKPGPATEVAHLGREPARHLGAINTPVYRASTILFESVADYEASQRGQSKSLNYGLRGLPTVTDLQAAVATLEGGHAALAVPSGLAATTLPLLALTSAGDHVLVTDSVYGPTRRFCNNHLTRLGVEVSYYDPLIGSGIEREMRPNTRAVFLESPGSLSFEVQDVSAIAAVAHAHGALVLLDNTWATPLNFRAFDHGVDVSLHAGTKYLGGHSDLLIGLIVGNKASFPRLHRLWTDTGVTASSDDCFLALRGLRTLAVRLDRHQASALRIAQWLREREEVAEVVYPALPGARGHELWKRDFTGACGLFGVILKPAPKARVDAMLDGLRWFKLGVSWGGFESLILPINDAMRSATRWAPGGPYIRLHVGLEDPDDLIDDLAEGLARLRA
jgi:cystathionine beta-lyase